MSVAFSSSDAEVLQRSVATKVSDLSPCHELEETYEIERCVKWIESRALQKVGLQFPDDLLIDAAEVTLAVESHIGRKVYILGDTSYGSCCVDEVAAEHVGADGIIHFGQTCLSPTRRLPVLYIFTRLLLDIEDAEKSFRSTFPDQNTAVIIMYDVRVHHAVGLLYSALQGDYENLVLADPTLDENVVTTELANKNCEKVFAEDSTNFNDGTYFCKLGRKFHLKQGTCVNDFKVFYIGEEGRTLTNMMMNFNSCVFYSYNPISRTCRQETLSVNKELMKRYYMIEKAKDARIVGILVGTLGVANYLTAIDRLKEMLKKAGKKSYTFVVGKLNVAKLANFAEIDVYVLVACPENSLLDSKDFYQPVITPYELEVACNKARKWTGEYITDFRELLPGAASHVEMETFDESETDVSLLSGEVRVMGLQSEEEKQNDNLIKRDDALTISTVHVKGGGEHLLKKTWRGLEQKLGETSVTMATVGKKGLAGGYADEREEMAETGDREMARTEGDEVINQ